MLVEAASLPPGTPLQADVCVVGAGPAGLTLARRLTAAGLDVLLLEAGSATPPPRGADVSGTVNVGLPYPLLESRARGLGGSSNRWDIVTPVGEPYVRLRELDELDFAARPDVVPSSWPFPKSSLAPHYREAWGLFGLPSPDAEQDADVAVPVQRRVFAFGPARTFREVVPGELRQVASCTVVTDAVVVDVRTDAEPDAVSSLSCRSTHGVPFTVTATTYVLAAGGVENARLLLASRSSQPGGLGNRRDVVGRYFMEHPHYASAVLAPEPGSPLLTDPQTWALAAPRGHAEQRKYGLAPDVVLREGLLNAAFYLSPRPVTKPVALRRDGSLDRTATESAHEVRMALMRRTAPSSRSTLRLASAAPRLALAAAGQALSARTARRGRSSRIPRLFTLAAMAEQVPRPDSRVQLTDRLDALGMPVATLDWRAGADDALSMRRTQELVGPALGGALRGRVASLLDAVDVPHLGWGFHHMGTTRMATDAERGVVDVDCRVHGVRNLYVSGSSVFPTGGCSNPTLTIVALAVRLADHLVALRSPVSVTSPGS